MNERIQQLAIQASTTTTSYYDGRGNVTETYFDKEKFAELIVRECIDYCGENLSKTVGGALKIHFGVEE
jgi:hypothetical protein